MLFAGVGGLTRERSVGTLELLEASPAPLMVILGGKMLGSVAISLVYLAFSYAVIGYKPGRLVTIKLRT